MCAVRRTALRVYSTPAAKSSTFRPKTKFLCFRQVFSVKKPNRNRRKCQFIDRFSQVYVKLFALHRANYIALTWIICRFSSLFCGLQPFFRHCIQNLFLFKSCKENCLTYLFVQFSQTGLLGWFLRLCRKIDFFTVCLKNLPVFEIVNKTYLILLVKKTSIIVLTLHKDLDKIYM